MARLITFFVPLLSALAFGLCVPLVNVMRGVDHFTVSITIMTAAVFVRLNRGMPTLDWKSLGLDERKRITSAIEKITFQYVSIVGMNAAILGMAAMCSVYDEVYWLRIPSYYSHFISAGWGFLVALAIMRMSYVVWRDYDVVKLQKQLIDAAGEREEIEKETKIAEVKVDEIKSAGLTKVAINAPQAWLDQS